jgi:hypothetical protein
MRQTYPPHYFYYNFKYPTIMGGRGGRCRERMVVRFTSTYATSAYHH